ncbi:MAG TPA: hypothetical protein RMH99_05780 [Sandaracinaceae bacterium LLY-WYZ-13_1]|nr:hypothetical protein [Sandaracinaceae bacterium LLY-WYZ-13_1]
MRGRIYVAEAPAGLAASIDVHPDRVEGRAEDGRAWIVPLAEAELEPGGFEGRHVFLRSADRAVTLVSDDPALVPALEAVADARLRSRLDAVVEHRRRHARRTTVERWLYRLRYPVLLAILAGLAAWLWRALGA